MTIKERLSKVDKKVWVGLICTIICILILSFFMFNWLGKCISLYVGHIFTAIITIFGMVELYFFILKKMKLISMMPFSFKCSFKINKNDSNDKGCEQVETTVSEEANHEAEVTAED